jgi:hypothetical protein
MCAQCTFTLLNTVQVCQVLADRSLDTMPPTQVNPELPPAEEPGQKKRRLSAGAPVRLEENCVVPLPCASRARRSELVGDLDECA